MDNVQKHNICIILRAIPAPNDDDDDEDDANSNNNA
jgi:hypothetical protein